MRISTENYYVYILANPGKDVLYTGVTNNLSQRLMEPYLNRGKADTFAGRYFCYGLLYHESFQYIDAAIAREKDIKRFTRQKKEELISAFNPAWKFLNSELFDKWPPEALFHRTDC